MPTRRLMGASLLLICLARTGAAAQERTEQELLEVILRDSPHAAAIRAGVEVVRREQAARTLPPNPRLSYTRESAGFTEFLQAEQLLPVFGLRGILVRAGVAAIEAAEAERDARLWTLRTEARSAIARLATEQERQAQAETTVAAIARLIAMLRTREQEGEGSRFDRVRAEQELADARQLVLAADIAVVTARGELRALLPPGVTIDRVTAITVSTDTPRADALWQRASKARAELRALERAALRVTHEAEAARRALRPTPSVMGGFKRADNGDVRESGAIFGVSVSLPLFNNGSRDAARWSAERDRAERERAMREAEIRGELTRAAEILASHQRALADPAFSRTSGDDLVEMAETAYREGEVGILELLDAYRTAARARSRAIELTLSARLAQIALERATGETLWP